MENKRQSITSPFKEISLTLHFRLKVKACEQFSRVNSSQVNAIKLIKVENWLHISKKLLAILKKNLITAPTKKLIPPKTLQSAIQNSTIKASQAYEAPKINPIKLITFKIRILIILDPPVSQN